MVDSPLIHSPLFPLLLFSLTGQKYSPDGTENIKDEYDYIIVGGGAAGSVVAGRLSEEPFVSVLLLEAGPKPPLISEIPNLSWSLLGTDVDWNFQTVPQKNLDGDYKYKGIKWNAGKMLGGSGSFNGMIYVRGNHKNYNDWATQGAKGWSYEDLLPYFLKLEDNKNLAFLDKGYHKSGGPITVQRPRFYSILRNPTYEAASELGYEFIDANGVRQTGFYDYQMNLRDGRRCSSVKGYLVPAEHRPNLDIMLNATVLKIIIDDNRAKGVVFHHNGDSQFVKARREVIISGGTVNTPKILMLSGIGPREELEKWNLPVIADLPVGKNLQDHGASKYYFTLDPIYSTISKFSDNSEIEDYINYRSGPLTNINKGALAFLRGLNATPSIDFPNYQLYFSETSKEYETSSEVKRKLFGSIDSNRAFCMCMSQYLQPRSKGTVTLRSRDPFDPPLIDPNYLEDPKDLDDIVEGLRMCEKIVNTKAFKSLGAKPFNTVMPGCEDFVDSDVDYFRCFAKHLFSTLYHYVGTAKMGDPRDSSTVVDPELRVKGVKGLRVVDASVMPIVTSGNTNIPTIMLAEKASDMIKQSIK